jgi:hypothetical protein
MRVINGAFVLAMAGIGTAFAQTAARLQDPTLVSIPFIGCASFGQSEKLEAPTGSSRTVPIGRRFADVLAYYRSANGLGVLAPRGWHCEGVSGSSGEALFVSPKPVNSRTSPWDGVKGPAVAVYRWSSDASGRFEVAELMIRVFTVYKSVARKYFEEMDLPAPSGAFPRDTLTYRGSTTVEYTTPAQSDGLGNFNSRLGSNDLPIKGAAIIRGNPLSNREAPDVVVLSVRVHSSLDAVVPVIVGQFELDAIPSGSPSH